MQHLFAVHERFFSSHLLLEATRLYFPISHFNALIRFDTIIICRRVFIERQDILGILVLDLLKRSEFTLQRSSHPLPLQPDNRLVILVDSNKINLQIIHLAYIHFLLPTQEFQKTIFSKCALIKRARAKQHTSQTNIHQIVFSQSFEELLLPLMLYRFTSYKKKDSQRVDRYFSTVFWSIFAHQPTSSLQYVSSREYCRYYLP